MKYVVFFVLDDYIDGNEPSKIDTMWYKNQKNMNIYLFTYNMNYERAKQFYTTKNYSNQ